MTARTRRRATLLWAATPLLAAALATPAARGEQGPVLRFAEPPAGQPLFGAFDVRLVAEGPGAEAIETVEVYLDGALAATLTQPPFLARLAVPATGGEHRLEAVALAAGSPIASAVFTSSALRIDAEIDVELRQLLVTVERDGLLVEGLRREDFSLVHREGEMEIETFAGGDLPFTVALLVDASLSMQGEALTGAVEAARTLVAALGPLDEAKLVLFDDSLRGETPFTNVPDVLRLGLAGVAAGGGSAIHDALWIAGSRLAERAGRRIVVLLSDGVDVESVLPFEAAARALGDARAQLHWLRLPGAIDRAGGGSVRLFTAWRGPEEHRDLLASLERLTAESGGSLRRVANPEEAKPALERLVSELRGQYVLGYSPSRSGASPEVRVRGGGTVRARPLGGDRDGGARRQR